MGILAPSNTCFLGPIRVHNLNGIPIGSAILDSSCQCRRAYRDMQFPLKIANSHGGSVPPFNTWFLMSTRLSIPHGISIGSAVFAQLTAGSPYTLQ